MTWWFTDIGPGYHTFIVQRYRTSYCNEMLAGWSDGSQENHITVEEVPVGSVGISQYFPDVRTTSGSWTDIPYRIVAFEKKYDDTDLFITYADTFGNNQRAHAQACGYRAYLYGPKYTSGVFLGENWSHSHLGSNWMIWPRELHYYAQRSSLNLSPGRYTLKVQWNRQAGSNECLAGWEDGTTANSLTMEEKHPANLAIVPSRLNSGNTRYGLGDYRTTAYKTWISTPGSLF
eukprot:m.42315 g.42315  ORF g.42315 m.42315 type:complete len:232 (+) comp7051_c0_seq1:176-871(+)